MRLHLRPPVASLTRWVYIICKYIHIFFIFSVSVGMFNFYGLHKKEFPFIDLSYHGSYFVIVTKEIPNILAFFKLLFLFVLHNRSVRLKLNWNAIILSEIRTRALTRVSGDEKRENFPSPFVTLFTFTLFM